MQPQRNYLNFGTILSVLIYECAAHQHTKSSLLCDFYRFILRSVFAFRPSCQQEIPTKQQSPLEIGFLLLCHLPESRSALSDMHI